MGCPICGNLKQAFEAELREYIEARSSVYYSFSTKIAAYGKVDMERSRYELEEHRFVCVSSIQMQALSRARDVSTNLRQVAA
jgi:hypothetical protein